MALQFFLFWAVYTTMTTVSMQCSVSCDLNVLLQSFIFNGTVVYVAPQWDTDPPFENHWDMILHDLKFNKNNLTSKFLLRFKV